MAVSGPVCSLCAGPGDDVVYLCFQDSNLIYAYRVQEEVELLSTFQVSVAWARGW